MKDSNGKTAMETMEKRGGFTFIKKYWAYIILIAYLLIFLFQTYYSIKYNNAPPHADEKFHLITPCRDYRLLVFDNPTRESVFMVAHPPLTYLVCQVFFLLFGVSIQVAKWSIFPFALIYIISVFGIGKYFGGDEGGLASALIVLSCHYFILQSHRFMLDFPMASILMLAVYFLLHSRFFDDRKNTFLFGIAMAFMMLTKWSGIFFIAPAVLIILIVRSHKSWKLILMALIPFIFLGVSLFFYYRGGLNAVSHPEVMPENYAGAGFIASYFIPFLLLFIVSLIFRKRIIDSFPDELKGSAVAVLNGVSAVLLAVLIDIPWYVYAQQSIVQKIIMQRSDVERLAGEIKGSVFLHTARLYLEFYGKVYLPFFVSALIGIVVSFIKREHLRSQLMILMMALSGLYFIIQSANPSLFYIIPLLGFVGVFGGYWIHHTRWFKAPLILFIMFYTGVSLAYTLPLSDNVRDRASHDYLGMGLAFDVEVMPDSSRYYIRDIVKDLAENSPQADPMRPETRLPVGVELSEEFEKIHHKTFMRSVEDNVFNTYSWYMGKGENFQFILNRDWRGRMGEFEKMPFFLIFCYVKKNEPATVMKFAEDRFGRKGKIISGYDIGDQRKLMLIEFPPK